MVIMNLRDLKYLVAVADCCHFGKAAQYCHVSQPALSMQLKKLEETFGVTLIERTNKSAMLTEVGKLITERARNLLIQVEEMKDIAGQARDPFSGKLTFGIIPTFAAYVLPHIIPGLTKAFPKLSLILIEEQTDRLLEKLQKGTIDVAFLALPIIETGLTVAPLFKEEFLLAMSQTHSLAKRSSIKPSDLKESVLLLLEEGHCMRDQALEFCHKISAIEENSFRATSLETLRHMVAANVGITLMPKLACKKNDGLKYLPFNTNKPCRIAGMVWRTSSSKKLVLESIGDQIKKLITKNKLQAVDVLVYP